MLLSGIPTKFPIPFANSAGVGFITTPIPTASLIGVSPGRASLTDGFPPLTFVPIASGGDPPWGADMNGILFEITSWNRWTAAGGAGSIPYDSSFSSSIAGYQKGALLNVAATNDRFWLSTVDNNVSNPDAGGANWDAFPDKIVQQQKGNYTAADAGTANHVAITLAPATTPANIIGAPVRFRIAFANTITNPDISINGSSAITMLNVDGTAIVIGQFPSTGCFVEGFLVTASDFRVTSPPKPVSFTSSPLPPGAIVMWGSSLLPTWGLECAGQLVAVVTYPNLFNVIGYTYGGSGANFRLPDARGVFVRGWDHGRGADPNASTRTNRGDGTTGDQPGTNQAAGIGPFTMNGTWGNPTVSFLPGLTLGNTPFSGGTVPFSINREFAPGAGAGGVGSGGTPNYLADYIGGGTATNIHSALTGQYFNCYSVELTGINYTGIGPDGTAGFAKDVVNGQVVGVLVDHFNGVFAGAGQTGDTRPVNIGFVFIIAF